MSSYKPRLLFFILLCAALTVLCACSGAEEPLSQGPVVYRVVSEEFLSGSELVRAEALPPDVSGEDELLRVLGAVEAGPPSTQTKPVLPPGVEIVDVRRHGGELQLELNAGYLELGGMDKTLTDYCLTLSLCSVEGVDTVSIYVAGAMRSAGLSADDALLFDTETNPYERHLRLYFTSAEGRYLSAEYRTLSVEGDDSLERYVVEELLRGPYSDMLSSAVPEGTQLLGVSPVEDRVCAVDLSAEFLSGMPEDIIGRRLAVLSIVNSLTSLSGVDGVLLLVNGEPLTSYGGFAFESPLERNERAIGPANSARGEADINIYVQTPDGRLAALPRIVSMNGYASFEEAVVREIISSGTEPGFEPLFPKECEFNSITFSGSLCVVGFPEAFPQRFSSRAELELALSALSLALKDLPSVSRVQFEVGGGVVRYNGERVLYS